MWKTLTRPTAARTYPNLSPFQSSIPFASRIAVVISSVTVPRFAAGINPGTHEKRGLSRGLRSKGALETGWERAFRSKEPCQLRSNGAYQLWSTNHLGGLDRPVEHLYKPTLLNTGKRGSGGK